MGSSPRALLARHRTLMGYSFASTLNSVTGMLAGFVILRWVAPAEYGIWQSVLILQSYAVIVQAGVVQGLNRELPFRLGAGDTNATELASTAQTLAVASSLLLVVAAAVSFFVVDDAMVRAALSAVLVVAAAGIYSNYLSVTFRADQAFDTLAKVYLGLAALNVVTLPIVYYLRYFGIPTRVVVIALVQLLAVHLSRPLRVPLGFRFAHVVTLLKVGVPLFCFGYAISIALTFPKTVLLLTEGTRLVGVFAPAAAVAAVITLLPKSIAQYVYAKMAFRYGRSGDPGALWGYAWKASLGVLAISAPLVGAVALGFPWLARTFFPRYLGAQSAVLGMCVAAAFLGSQMFSSALNSLKAWGWISIFTSSRVTLSFVLPFAAYLAFPKDPLASVSTGYASAGLVSFALGLFCTYRATHPRTKEARATGPEGFFFILTPLQYLCAEEARAKFGDRLSKQHLVILTAGKAILPQLSRVIDNAIWDSVTYREDCPSGRAMERRVGLYGEVRQRKTAADRCLSAIKSGDFVFLGNIEDEPCTYISKKVEGRAKIIVLDDGMATVGYLLGRRRNSLLQSVSLRDVFLWAYWRPRPPDRARLTFFSVFSELPYDPSQHVENSFKLLAAKNAQRNRIVRRRTIFIGQTLAKLGILPVERYVETVAAVKEAACLQGHEFVYYAHRSEDFSILPPDWEVVVGDRPLELILAESDETPSDVWTFYSSAAFNLHMILGSEVCFWFVKPGRLEINPRYREPVRTVFEYLEHSESDWANLVEPSGILPRRASARLASS